jgi:ATP-dependent DNA helicase RecG
MNKQDLERLIKEGENEQTEFKEKFDDSVIEALSAFSNSSGGRVLVGVTDKNDIKGVSLGKETLAEYANKIKQTTYPQLFPNIDTIAVSGKNILIFDINEFPIKPVAFRNRYFKRVKNSNHVLSLEEIVALQQESLNISYDAQKSKYSLSSLNTELIARFIEQVKSKGRINLQDDPVTNLAKLKLIKDGSPVLAAVLLFANDEYMIHLGRFKSEDIIIDDLIIKKPLMEALLEAMIFIKKHINLSFEIKGKLEREEKWQYPIDVLRELLLNCVVHRDYRNTSDIVVKVFDNKVSFTNPGKLYGNITIKDLERDDYVSSLRNKLLAEMFYLMGDIEKYGTGFIRIRKRLKDYPNLALNFGEIGDYFKADIIYTPSITPLITPSITPSMLTKLEALILEQIKKDNSIAMPKIASNLKISKNTVKEYTDKLKRKKIIKRVGPNRGGYWKML